MKKIIILLIFFIISFVLISGCNSIIPSNAPQKQSQPTCVVIKCVPKANDPGKPSCSQEIDYTNKECIKPLAPIVGTWEGYGTTQTLSYAKFVFSKDHMLTMTGIPYIGSQTANWYRCGDELDCLNQGLDNTHYIIISGIYHNAIIQYDGTLKSITFQGSTLIKQ